MRGKARSPQEEIEFNQLLEYTQENSDLRGLGSEISILKNYDDIHIEGPVAYIFKGNYPKEGIS